MASSSSDRRGSRSSRKSSVPPIEQDNTRLSRELEELREKELEIKRRHEEIQRRVADLPRQIEERERKQREMIRLRAMATATTADGFSRPRDKRYTASRTSPVPRRRTRPEERSARLQFMGLIIVLAAVLFLLWHSVQR